MQNEADEQIEIKAFDPNELPFDPKNDPFLEDRNILSMASCKFK